MSNQQTCTITGYQPNHFSFRYNEEHPDCQCLKQTMQTRIMALIARGVNTFLTGMSMGVDIWGAEIVLSLRERHPALRLIAVLPYETRANKWPNKQRERYFNILAECSETLYISHHYVHGCMYQRNCWLIDHAGIILAVYDGEPKGNTAYAVRYAEKQRRKVILIHQQTAEAISVYSETKE